MEEYVDVYRSESRPDMRFTTRVYHYGKGEVKVHIPIRTPEEEEQRRKELTDALREFVYSNYDYFYGANEEKILKESV